MPELRDLNRVVLQATLAQLSKSRVNHIELSALPTNYLAYNKAYLKNLRKSPRHAVDALP